MALKTWRLFEMPPQKWGAESRQVNVVVATSTKKAALEAFRAAGLTNLSMHHFSGYGSQTWNEKDIEVTTSKPGTVFWSEDGYNREYHEVPTDTPMAGSSASP